MLVSYNEILTTTRKVLESLGWAQGDWEDGAEAIAWLELHGMGGIGRFFNALPTLQNPYSHLLKKQSPHEFDANGGNCLLIGSWVIDYAYAVAKAAENKTRTAHVTLRNCRNPFLLIPYLLRCAQRNIQVSTAWCSDDSPSDGWIVYCTHNAQYPDIHSYTHLHGEMRPKTNLQLSVSEHISFPYFNASPDNVQRWRSKTDFVEIASNKLQTGIEIHDNHWNMLKELAKGILVPETEESRRRGAGENS